jgi:hypothetical protein
VALVWQLAGPQRRPVPVSGPETPLFSGR